MTKLIKRRLENDDYLDAQVREQVGGGVLCVVGWHTWDQMNLAPSDLVEEQVEEQLS